MSSGGGSPRDDDDVPAAAAADSFYYQQRAKVRKRQGTMGRKLIVWKQEVGTAKVFAAGAS